MRCRAAVALVVVGCSATAEPPTTERPREAPAPGVSPPGAPPPGAPPSDDCPAGKTCVTLAPTDSEAQLAGAFATAKPGTVLLLGRGTFALTNTLALSGTGVTVRGAGRDETILDFGGQRAGSEGVLAENAEDLLLESFSVRDPQGNGVKLLGGDKVTMRDLGVSWTSRDATTHGPYGLYPVQSTRVLVEGCVVSGASDAGIYLGQSRAAVVRRNMATGNVSGIEIENSSDVDVYENEVVANAQGILVVDLPWPPRTGSRAVRVRENVITDNNAESFSTEGSFVASLPRGVGLLLMATDDVEVFANTFRRNRTVNVAVMSFFVTGSAIENADYAPYPSRVFIHDNTFGEGGDAPDVTKWIGALLDAGMPAYPDRTVPSIVFDGTRDPAKGSGPNPQELCLRANGDATFANLHLPRRNPELGDVARRVTTDPAPHDCALPPVRPPRLDP